MPYKDKTDSRLRTYQREYKRNYREHGKLLKRYTAYAANARATGSTVKTFNEYKMENKLHKYVLGFCFNEDYSKVALIRKNRPGWQKGLLNGIGGKVDGTESDLEAMTREFTEETSVRVEYWRRFATMKSMPNGARAFVNNRWEEHPDPENWEVAVFASNISDELFDQLKTTTDEPVTTLPIALLDYFKTIDNIKWLVNLAIGKLANITYEIKVHN